MNKDAAWISFAESRCTEILILGHFLVLLAGDYGSLPRREYIAAAKCCSGLDVISIRHPHVKWLWHGVSSAKFG